MNSVQYRYQIVQFFTKINAKFSLYFHLPSLIRFFCLGSNIPDRSISHSRWPYYKINRNPHENRLWTLLCIFAYFSIRKSQNLLFYRVCNYPYMSNCHLSKSHTHVWLPAWSHLYRQKSQTRNITRIHLPHYSHIHLYRLDTYRCTYPHLKNFLLQTQISIHSESYPNIDLSRDRPPIREAILHAITPHTSNYWQTSKKFRARSSLHLWMFQYRCFRCFGVHTPVRNICHYDNFLRKCCRCGKERLKDRWIGSALPILRLLYISNGKFDGITGSNEYLFSLRLLRLRMNHWSLLVFHHQM